MSLTVRLDYPATDTDAGWSSAGRNSIGMLFIIFMVYIHNDIRPLSQKIKE